MFGKASRASDTGRCCSKHLLRRVRTISSSSTCHSLPHAYLFQSNQTSWRFALHHRLLLIKRLHQVILQSNFWTSGTEQFHLCIVKDKMWEVKRKCTLSSGSGTRSASPR